MISNFGHLECLLSYMQSSNGYEEELTEAIKQHNINGSAVAITN
jgi:hypothetical protein